MSEKFFFETVFFVSGVRQPTIVTRGGALFVSNSTADSASMMMETGRREN